MTWEIQYVLGVIALASALFASGRVRFDIVASLVIMALTLGGILTPEEAFAGFSNPVVVLVAALLILGEILTRTGVAYAVGNWLTRFGGSSETRLLVLLMLTAATLGSVMSSTAVVAILIPVMLQVGRQTNIHPCRLLLPLSYAALISGMLTLIATIPNIVVSAELGQRGYEPLSFFSITPIGLTVLGVAVAYMVLLGRRLLPQRNPTSPALKPSSQRALFESFELGSKGRILTLPPNSMLTGLKLRDSLITRFNVRVLMIARPEILRDAVLTNPTGDTVLKGGDSLVVTGTDEEIAELALAGGTAVQPITAADRERWLKDAGGIAALVHPESDLIGRSVVSARFQSHYGVQVLRIRRKGEVLKEVRHCKLESGDALLLVGGWNAIQKLQTASHDFILLNKPREMEQYIPQRRKAPIALLIVLGMVLLSAFKVVPVVMAVLLAVGAGVITRCITMDDAYRVIPWSSIVLIAGMLPVADALQKTGGVDLIVDGLVNGVGTHGPIAMLTAIFFVSAGMGLFLSNSGTAVLLAPIAIRAAEVMGVAPYAFAMTVALAASASFVTPFSTPVVTLVVEPGGYRFTDFIKLGVPLLLLTWLIAVLLLPCLFPFG